MATLSGNKIKNTYQSLVKFSDNGNITTSAKQLTDGFGNNSPMYVSTTQVGIGVTPESGLNLHVYGDAKIGSNLTVIGNLVVEGSTTTVGTDTLTVKDPLIVLANNNTSTDAVDIGFYGKYTPSGTTLYSGLFREALTGKYRLFKGLESEPTTTVNLSGTGYAKADLIIGNIETNGLSEGSSLFNFTKNVAIDGTFSVTGGSEFDSTISHIEVATTVTKFTGITGSGYNASKLEFFYNTDLKIRLNGEDGSIAAGGNLGVDGNISAGGTGSFTGQVTIPQTPTSNTHAASKGYVDTQIGSNNELSEVLANGNTTGGTDIAITAGDKITNFTSTGIDDNATSNVLTIADASSNFAGNFAVNTDKFTANATSGNVAFTGDLAINTNKFTVNATSGNISAAGTGTFGGNVGIGITPVSFSQLHIYDTSDIFITLQKGTDIAYLINDGTNIALASDQGSTGKKLLVDRTAPDNSLAIDSSGNSTFAGSITANTGSKITSSSADTTFSIETTSGTTIFPILDFVSSHSSAGARIRVSGTDVISIDKSQNSTFANRVSAGESFNSVKDGADTVADGPFFALKNAAGTRQYLWQLDASNNIDYWYYNGSTWTQTISLLNNGGATFTGDVKINTAVSTLGNLSVKSDSGANTFYNNIQCIPSDSNTGGLFIGSNVANDAIMVTGAYYANAGNYTPTSTSASIINMFSGNIVFRTDDSLTVGTNYVPTERMRIDSSGKLGIGNSNPSYKIDAKQTTSGNGTCDLRLAGRRANSTTSFIVSTIYAENFDNGTGDVTIGKIDFSIDGDATGDQSQYGKMIFSTANNSSEVIALTIDSSQNATFAGNVGIGGSPDSPLHLSQAAANTFFKMEAYASTQGADAGINVARELTSGSSSNLSFWTNTGSALTQKLTIDSSGNVGIGTDSPDAKLDILGLDLNIGADNGAPTTRTNSTVKVGVITSPHYTTSEENFTGMLLVGNTTVNEVAIGGGTSTYNSATQIKFYTASNSTTVTGTERMRIDSSGNVTIKAPTASGGGVLNLENTTTSVNGQDWGSLNFISNDSSTSASGIRASVVGTSTSFNGDGNLVFSTAPSNGTIAERMRIDSSGNVGIGTVTPSTLLEIQTAGTTGSQDFQIFSRGESPNYEVFKISRTAGSTELLANQNLTLSADYDANHTSVDSNIIFKTDNTERMRITSGGDFEFKNGTLKVGDSTTAELLIIPTTNNTAPALLQFHKEDTGASTVLQFLQASTQKGSISYTNTTTSFNTTSDYRLKEDLQDFAGLDMVSKIPVYDFKWKTDESRSYGVMAHELQEVLPDAVSGDKDAEEMQGVDYSKIVPLLVKSIQELTAKVDKLEQECKCK